MKQLFTCVCVLLLTASAAFSADFSPTPMELSAPETVTYAFDGSKLEIPVTVGGAPGSALLLVFTKGKGAEIGEVQNGFLGWHYVNKIDTCVYVSLAQALSVGANTVSWDGTDADGGVVPEDDYTYYIWAFDNQNTRIPMSTQISMQPWSRATIIKYDEDGNPLDRPIVHQGSHARGGNAEKAPIPHVNKRWIVGSDPEDATLLETSASSGDCDPGGDWILSDDHSMYFKCGLWSNLGVKRVTKWQWVPNGDSVLQTDWGDEGIYEYTVMHPATWEFGPGISSDGADMLIAATSDLSGDGDESELIFIDMADGVEIKRIDLSTFYVSPEDAENDGQMSSGPTELTLEKGTLIAGSHSSCMNLLFDPFYENDEDAVLWANDNGDYTGDHNFEETALNPWVCNDYNVGPYKYNIVTDANLFATFSSFDVGAVSFGLYAPDGTGLGYHAFAGETADQKYDFMAIDYGSAYDGYYTTNRMEGSSNWYFIAHDSISGTISSGVGVADEAPAAFAVAQNSPNPFNPTTTINFSLAQAGNVTVDVYNVAGQKIDTIANEFMDSGSHSVVWDASGFSAGVYFYTVNTGDFSKTMKMTLLK